MMPPPRRPLPRPARGLTLIELVIAMVVIAVLVAIGMASFTWAVAASRRTDAKNALLDLAAREERYYAANNQYTNSPTSLGYVANAWPAAVPGSGTQTYSLSVTAAGATSFTAQAVRTAGGPQANDTCGDYAINDQGVQSNANNTQATAQCW